MKIAILGSGRIGAGLGRAWAARGHAVVLGVRDPDDVEVQALARPVYGDLAASNVFCGDDAEGRQMVRQLVEDAGFDPTDVGLLANARLVEPMMLVWMAASRSLGTRDLAFRVLRR